MIDRWQKIDYTYNIRGWLTRINDIGPVLMGKDAEPPTLGDDLFAFGIQYNELANGGSSITEPLYNGNIAQTFWKTAEDNILRGYHYTYDQMNRLRRADFYKQGNANITAYGEFIAYDVNGNIKNLVRSTGDATDNEIEMDDLAYTYQSGNGNSNRLMKVVENVTTGGGTGGFNNGTSGTNNDYTYDNNGNMTSDLNKGITSITYNHLNLPTQIYWAADKKIDYLYNAAGQKVKKTVRDGGTIKTVDYLDGFQYAGGILQFFPTAEGYVKATQVSESPTNPDYAFNYVFNYTDHLGNVRLSFSKDPVTHQLKIMEENHYYPFGLKHSVYNAGSLKDYKEDPAGPGTTVITNVTETDYQYKYQGQERQDELGLNWDSFKYRNYDYVIGRFMSIDPLAEKYSYQSPYNFAENRVVDGRELEGLEWVDANGNQIYDPKKGEYTSHATFSDKTLGDGLRNSGDTGATQFNTLVNSTNPIRIERNTTKGADVTEADGGVYKSYQFGYTDSGKDVKSSYKGNELVDIEFKVTQVITINEKTIAEFFNDAKTYPDAFKSAENKEEAGFVQEGMSISEFIYGILGHEIGHTTKENVMTQIKGGDNEAGPTETGRQIMRDIMKEKEKKDE